MEKILKTLSIIADVITITGISFAAIWGLLKSNKSLTGFKLNYFVSYIFRTGIILFISVILLRSLQPVYEIFLVIIKGNNYNLVWENGKEIQYILSYFLTTAVGLFIFWLLVPIVWTSSIIYAIELINKFLPNAYKIKVENFKNDKIFHIIKAVYGTEDNNYSVDVTSQLQNMVKNGSLRVNANNDLAGDPKVGIIKYLTIDYVVNGLTKKEIIKEGETKIIPN